MLLGGCGPKYVSGSTECSDKGECPSGYVCGGSGTATKVCVQSCANGGTCDSGFICANDGVNPFDVCIENSKANCQSGYTYFCKSTVTCWPAAVACSTIVNCGTTSTPLYRACSMASYHFDCTAQSCSATTTTGGSGGTASGGVSGSGGLKTDAGLGGASGSGGSKTGSGGTKTDAGVGGASGSGGSGSKDAGVSCTTSTTCASGQQCLGGQCCPAPLSGGECNQLPACGCATGKVCYPSSTTRAMACVTGSNLAEGADCTSGLSCQAGLGCFGGTCKRYCNSASDCPAVAGLQNCVQTTWSDDNTNIPGVKVCSRICDPAHPQSPTAPLLACPTGFSCQASSTGLSYCLQSTPLPSGSTCTTAVDCMPGYYCTVGGECNKYCLGNADCPSGKTCVAFTTTTLAGTYSVGYCGP
jgi:hypothetical protein